jgi:hypothetical protein
MLTFLFLIIIFFLVPKSSRVPLVITVILSFIFPPLGLIAMIYFLLRGRKKEKGASAAEGKRYA